MENIYSMCSTVSISLISNLVQNPRYKSQERNIACQKSEGKSASDCLPYELRAKMAWEVIESIISAYVNFNQ